MIKSRNRSISYVSSHISSQALTHREKNKDFPAEKYISCYQLRDDETHELTTPPSFFNEKFFNDLYKLAELNNFTAEELRNYMKRLFAVSDYENSIEFAKAESRAEGVELAKTAINMLKDGIAIDQICKDTGLTEGQVAELQALL